MLIDKEKSGIGAYSAEHFIRSNVFQYTGLRNDWIFALVYPSCSLLASCPAGPHSLSSSLVAFAPVSDSRDRGERRSRIAQGNHYAAIEIAEQQSAARLVRNSASSALSA